MKTITIYTHPEYWGAITTDAQARRWSSKMAECAEQAGFSFDGTSLEGTTAAAKHYSHGFNAEEDIEWFPRWCSHGFRGMVAWLKKQIAE